MQSFHNFLTAHIVAIDKTHGQNFLNAGYYFVMLLTAANLHADPYHFAIFIREHVKPDYPKTAWQNDRSEAVSRLITPAGSVFNLGMVRKQQIGLTLCPCRDVSARPL